ncbi:MAG: class I SAM-dependent methyltransferase [Thermodesulfovibrionales bacterium]
MTVAVKWKRLMPSARFICRLPIMSNHGYCVTCDSETTFRSASEWLRDGYVCSKCGSLPRERALMVCIERNYPHWRDLSILEVSPSHVGASAKIRKHCSRYMRSHFFNEFPRGTLHHSGFRCEDLEAMTFPDESFDLVISQDVMEHVFAPAKAFAEIARILKPGGAHLFSVPLVNKERPSEAWAIKDSRGAIVHLQQPEYHSNPVDEKGSLVTMHWGYDISDYISTNSGLTTTITTIDDISMGIRAEYIEILVSKKIK